jgi:hypothetical protein
MTKKTFISILGSFALAFMLLASPAIIAQPASISTYQVDEGECEKCGKEDCKGCEGKEAKKGKKGKAGKSCAGKGEGKSCCAHGNKKETKAEATEKVEEEKK